MTTPIRATPAPSTRHAWQQPVLSKLASRDAQNTPVPGAADGSASFGS